MSGNGEKFCRQRQEQQRPSFSFHSCPVFISSSPSRISFSSSHGRNSLSTKEKETRIHLTSINKFSGRKQCLKDSTRNKTYSDDIRRCKSTESIRYLNVDQKRFNRIENGFDIIKQRLKKKSLSYPEIEKDYLSESESLFSTTFKDYNTYTKGNAIKTEQCSKTSNNCRKSTKTAPHGKQTICKIERPKVVQKRSSLKTSIKTTSSDVEPKVSFPNSLLLFPFPTTPVEKCFSPKTPTTTPIAWNNSDKTDPSLTDNKKTKGSRFEFGANFLRRFSLTQLTSPFNTSTKSKHGEKKVSLTNVPTHAFDFNNMSSFRGSPLNDTVSVGVEESEMDENRPEDDLLIPSPTFKLCQRSQVRRNTDFSQASQDLKKFLAERESKRRDSDQEILDIGLSGDITSSYNPEKFKRDIFPTRVYGSVEKLPGEKPVPENAIKGKPDNCNNRVAKENCRVAIKDDEEGRPRTCSFGEKGFKTNGSHSKNGVTPLINNNRPAHCHASSSGSSGTVVGTCNENFFKQPPKKAIVKDPSPIKNTVSQTAKVKQRRFRVESSDSSVDRQESIDIPSQPVLENPEHHTLWYCKFFLGKYHYNFVGQEVNSDGEKSIYVLSLVEEISFGKTHCRCIMWAKDGPKRLFIAGSFKSKGLRQILAQFQFNGSKIDQSPKQVMNPSIQKDLFTLEKQERAMNLKFGVIYAKESQKTDDEFLSNQEESKSFLNFLDLLGERIDLKGWDRYNGGLDTQNDMTGTQSYFTLFEEHQVMFHVSTMLPYSNEDIQQVERKRHIGNDIVNIIFMDGSVEETSHFQPKYIKSHFTHIYAVVCYQEDTDTYHLSVLSDDSVPLFGPLLTNQTKFTDHDDFVRFLLVKLINGEKATYKANVFSSKRERTYDMLLQDIYEKYIVDEHSLESYANTFGGSTSINKLYGNNRKLKDQKDAYVKMGQELRLDSLLSTRASLSLHMSGGTNGSRGNRHATTNKSPWEPICFYPNFPHQVVCGDSWKNSALILGTSNGTFLILAPSKKPILLFDTSLGIAVQLSIIEPYGIMIIRFEKEISSIYNSNTTSSSGSGGKIYVFRLSELEEYLVELMEWNHNVDSLLHNENNEFQNDQNLQKNNNQRNQQRPHWEPKSKSDVRPNLIEQSRGSTLFSVSRRGEFPLRLCFAIGKRIFLMRWRHDKEWISLTDDTSEGFLLEADCQVHETPHVITILEGNSEMKSPTSPDESPTTDCGAIFSNSAASILHVTSSSVGQPAATPTATSPSSNNPSPINTIQILVGSRHQFELIRILPKATGHHHILSSRSSEMVEIMKLHSIPTTDASAIGAIEATEISYNEQSEVLLSYNSTSHIQKMECDAPETHKISWNSVPVCKVVCAFPYILAFTPVAIEFRYAVNGSLLQTLAMPELRLISAKDDLYLCSTRQPVSTRKPLDSGYQEEDYRYLYKIPWTHLTGGGGGAQQQSNTRNQR